MPLFRLGQTAQVQSKGVNVQVQKLVAGHLLALGSHKGGFLKCIDLPSSPWQVTFWTGVGWPGRRIESSAARPCWESGEQSEGCLENKMPRNSSYSGSKRQFRKGHCLEDQHKRYVFILLQHLCIAQPHFGYVKFFLLGTASTWYLSHDYYVELDGCPTFQLQCKTLRIFNKMHKWLYYYFWKDKIISRSGVHGKKVMNVSILKFFLSFQQFLLLNKGK